ncbi:hypothetical protein CHELA20_51825 [Hyphomicrobiales bacterium]|nr:hypothetical protein CHELA20_51825 [Hyphomicrobiales bacterium]
MRLRPLKLLFGHQSQTLGIAIMIKDRGYRSPKLRDRLGGFTRLRKCQRRN